MFTKTIRYLQEQTRECRVIDQVVLELNSLMTVGMNDLRQRTFLHSGCKGLLLKEVLRASTVWCRG